MVSIYVATFFRKCGLNEKINPSTF